MKAIEYVMTGMMSILCNKSRKNFNDLYDKEHFYLPRLYCSDGFNVSIQCNCCHYCKSENGYRKFGWITDVEWGYPSTEESLLETINHPVGMISIEILEKLVEKHGGIDMQKTFELNTKIECKSRRSYIKTKH